MGGLGALDVIGGFLAGIIVSALAYGVKRYKLPRLLIIPIIVLGNGLIVPIWLSYLIGVPYFTLAISIAIGQIPSGIIAYILITILDEHMKRVGGGDVNMKKSIKMVVSDLDRTLLRNDKTISDYTTEVLQKCKEQGIIVAFATARSADHSEKFIEKIKPDAVVLNGGSLAYVGSRVVYSRPMDIETTNTLLQILHSSEFVRYITAETDKGLFANISKAEYWPDFPPVYHVDFKESLDAHAFKVVAEIFDDKAILNIKSVLADINIIKFVNEDWVCFADKSANKLEGIKALAAHYNISIEEVAAFGDDYNDIEMLRGCGIGVAVGNAIDEAKVSANYICDTNENDGLAKWIEENLLSD